MFAEVAQDATRLIKLNKAIALHRLLVVFISSNPAYYVVIPSLEMLEQCLSTLVWRTSTDHSKQKVDSLYLPRPYRAYGGMIFKDMSFA
jgi:hypothetical protein